MADTVVIDQGSCKTKVGLAKDESPKEFPTIVGKLREGMITGGIESFVGDDAVSRRAYLDIRYPVLNGVIDLWDEMEILWKYLFDTVLSVAPSEQPVLLADKFANTSIQIEKIAQIMFETFHVPSLYIAPQPLLALKAAGIQTGLVVDAGEIAVTAYPIVESVVQREKIKRAEIGGTHIRDRLSLDIGQNVEIEVVDIVKEAVCFVSQDYEGDLAAGVAPKSYELPNGNVITIGNGQFTSAEVLFQPSMAGTTCAGVHEIANAAITACGESPRKGLLENIVLVGAASKLPGTAERLEKELKVLAPSADVKVIATDNREYSTWIGGSMLSKDPTFPEACLTKQEYEESGPALVAEKFSDIVLL